MVQQLYSPLRWIALQAAGQGGYGDEAEHARRAGRATTHADNANNATKHYILHTQTIISRHTKDT